MYWGFRVKGKIFIVEGGDADTAKASLEELIPRGSGYQMLSNLPRHLISSLQDRV